MYNIESGVTLSFDGINRRIILDIEVTGTTVKITDIFNYWRIWVTDSGSSFYQALDRTGGELIESNKNISYYYILVNNWKMITTTSLLDYVDLVLDGNLITNDNTNPIALSESTGRIYIRSVISTSLITTSGSSGGSCTGITEQLNIIQSGVTNIDTNVNTLLTYNSGITNQLLLIGSGVTNIEDQLALHRAETEDRIKYILGLVQQNFRIFNQVYDANNLLTNSNIRIYNNAADALANINPLKTYTMFANYDAQGRLIEYLVTE